MRRTSTLLALALFVPAVARAQDVPESSPEALSHYARGIDGYVHERFDEAIGHFAMAYDLDHTFHLAHLMAAITAGNAGQRAKADSFAALVVPYKATLSPYYQYRLEAHLAGAKGDIAAMVEENRKAAALGPGTKASYNVAQAAVQRGLATEALTSLRRLDPDHEPMKGWFSYYAIYSSAAHQAGEHEEELQMARRARKAFPNDLRAAGYEADALAALGRGAEVERVLAEIERMPSVRTITPGQVLASTAQELGAHGNAAASTRWLERSLRWYEALPDSQARTTDNRADRAYTLYLLGRYGQAASIYDSLAREFPNAAPWKAWRGYMAARLGDRATAMDVANRIERGEIKFIPATALMWRGIIAMGLNDRVNAIALLRQSGVYNVLMHRDPVVLKVLANDPTWIAYLHSDGRR